jgi:hypothetical protein
MPTLEIHEHHEKQRIITSKLPSTIARRRSTPRPAPMRRLRSTQKWHMDTIRTRPSTTSTLPGCMPTNTEVDFVFCPNLLARTTHMRDQARCHPGSMATLVHGPAYLSQRRGLFARAVWKNR